MSEIKIAVIGSGSWGTALANIFTDAGNDVVLWGRNQEVVDSINKNHKNIKYLKDVPLNTKLHASSDLAGVLKKNEVIICSIPTQQIRQVFKPHQNLLKGKHIINTSKGIEIGTDFRVSQIFKEISPDIKYSIISGPSFAEEAVKRLPTAVTVASENKVEAEYVQSLSRTPYFRAYTSQDVVGVEYAGALKNIIAIASGIVAGLKLGYNTQAALINRGMAEIVRMSKFEKADSMTFLGLSGMGDLILTCTGPLSRNRRLGFLIGEGKSLEESIQQLGGVAEGYYTAKSAYELSLKHKIEMPIIIEMYKILYEKSTPLKALNELMSRDLKEEW